MKKIKTLVVWKTDKNLGFDIPEEITVTWSNPKFWNGVPRPIHDAVYAPDYPEIEKTHEKYGKVIWRPEEETKEETGLQSDERIVVDDVPDVAYDESEEADDSETETNEEEVVDEEENDEGEDWRNLSWPKMRSLATEFTEEPVKSKAQAQEVLEQAEQDGKL